MYGVFFHGGVGIVAQIGFTKTGMADMVIYKKKSRLLDEY